MDEVKASLQSIARGTIFSSIGIFLALLFSFLQRWTIIRITTPDQYGLYSLSLAVVAIFVCVGRLGLQDGIARTVSFSRDARPGTFVSSVLLFSLVSGGGCLLFLFIFSPYISSFFGKDINWILRILMISIPFTLLLEYSVSLYRGKEKTEFKVIFNDILKNAIFILILIGAFVMDVPLSIIVAGYVISIAVPAITIITYAAHTMGVQTSKILPTSKNLLVFSLPLMAGSIFQLIIGSADTLLLGVFNPSTDIGMYNAALPTAKLIQTFLGAVLLIFVPVATSLFSRGLEKELKRIYAVISKWVLFFTFPFFLVLFLHADQIFQFLYGSSYAPAVFPFKIMAVGYVLNAALGPNQGALIAVGRTKALMGVIIMTALINLVCNILLIPPFGIVGAALSMVITLSISSAVKGSALYILTGIHPFTRNFIYSICGAVMLAGGLHILIASIISVDTWMLPLFLILYMGGYGVSMVVTRSIDPEDIWMLTLFEKRTGVNLYIFKKVLKKFLK